MDDQTGPAYHIWGIDNAAYGPVELPVLVDWIKDDRVTADTWLYLEQSATWIKANAVPELHVFFHSAIPQATENPAAAPQSSPRAIHPAALRRIRLLAAMDDSELAEFNKHIRVQEYKRFAPVVRANDHGDAMYLILSGELRARILAEGQDTTLATLGAGDYFGEIALLDHGACSADIIANADSVVLKLSAESFQRLMTESPKVALDFLYGLARSTGGKVRALTKRYQDSIYFSRLGL